MNILITAFCCPNVIKSHWGTIYALSFHKKSFVTELNCVTPQAKSQPKLPISQQVRHNEDDIERVLIVPNLSDFPNKVESLNSPPEALPCREECLWRGEDGVAIDTMVGRAEWS